MECIILDPMTARVKQMRIARGWNQAELAFRAGCSQASISRIENNQQNATLGAVRGVAKAFGVSVAELFEPPTPSEAARLASRWASLSPDHQLVIEAALEALERRQIPEG